MAITWGAWTGRGRVGVELTRSPSTVTTNTTEVTIRARFYWMTDYSSYNYDARVRSWGDGISDTIVEKRVTSTGTAILFRDVSFTAATFYSDSRTFDFRADATSDGTSGTASVADSITVPRRPASPPDRVGLPAASTRTTDSVRITWDAPGTNGTSITGYQVKISADSNMDSGYVTVTTGSSVRYYTHDGIGPNATRWLAVRADSSAGYGDWSSVRSMSSLDDVPDPPQAPYFLSVTSSSAQFRTTQNANNGQTITNVRWRYRAVGTTTWTTVSPGSWEAMTVTGLARATTYEVQAAAYNSIGWSNWSTTAKFTTLATVPDQPPAPTFGSITSSSVSVSFSPASDGGSDIDGRVVELSTSSSFSSIAASGTSSPASMTGLSRATRYYARSRFRNKIGWSANSPVVSFDTNPTAPDATSISGATGVTSSSATINWVAPDDGGSPISSYEIQWATNSSFSDALSATVTTTSRTISGLTRASAYSVRVKSTNTVGASAWSPTFTFTTDATVPDQVAQPKIGAIDTEQATVTWTAPTTGGSAITGYQVKYTANGTTITKTVGNVLTTTLTGLAPGTLHTVTVAAINGVGVGAASSSASFETLSGAVVKVSGQWVTAKAYVKVSGTWKPAKVHKKSGDAWTL